MIAIAICEIGSLAERRIAMLVDPALSGLPAFLTPQPGLNSGFMMPQVTAAALVSENKQRAYPGQRRFDPDLGQPGGPRVDGGARRAPAAADGGERRRRDRHRARWPRRRAATSIRPLASSPPLERARARLRECVPRLDDDRYLAPDIAAATDLVRSGALTAATDLDLPGIEGRNA